MKMLDSWCFACRCRAKS